MQPLVLRCRPRALVLLLLCIVGLLLLAGLLASLLLWQTSYDTALGFIPSFRFDRERSVPTYFSVLLLAACSCLLALIAVAGRQRPAGTYVTHWWVLAFVFGLMSIDELVGLHERLMAPVRRLLDIEGPSLLYFAWVVPGLVFVALLGLYFLPFLWRLPRPIAFRFMLAGAIYVGGALGVEMAGGYYASTFPDWQTKGTDAFFGYELIVMLEETMEMLGLIVFVHALLLYLARHVGDITIAFD